jgi:hypothetical protein
MQGESYHWADWTNADIFCFMMVESKVTWCDIVMNKPIQVDHMINRVLPVMKSSEPFPYK